MSKLNRLLRINKAQIQEELQQSIAQSITDSCITNNYNGPKTPEVDANTVTTPGSTADKIFVLSNEKIHISPVDGAYVFINPYNLMTVSKVLTSDGWTYTPTDCGNDIEMERKYENGNRSITMRWFPDGSN